MKFGRILIRNQPQYLFNNEADLKDLINLHKAKFFWMIWSKFWKRISDARYSRIRLVAENARDVIYRMSLPDGKYKYISRASIDLFGYTPDEFYNSPILIKNSIHPDWIEYFEMQWSKLIQGDMDPSYEYQIIHKSGEIRYLHQLNTLITDNKGNPVAIEGIIRDVTELKQREKEIEHYRSHLEELIEVRTQELAEKNESLERMNKLFVGRELKMRELKKEIKTLKSQLGRENTKI